jgi:hypothetical protein
MTNTPPVPGSSSNSLDDLETSSGLRASDRIIPRDALLVGYLHLPAQININIGIAPSNLITHASINIKDVNFIGPELDISPLYNELKELKEVLKEILDSKKLSQEIGNELVGETYLRWDTQVRFYPTVVFIFLESDENYLKRSMLDKSISRKKIQIKLRITKHTIEEFNSNQESLKEYVIELKSKVLNSIDTYKFISGNIRCTYVNQGSVSWKTTIFAQNKTEAALILTRLCNLIGEVVNPKFLTSGDVRSASTQESKIPVYLHKVSLLINKLKEQILIYHV